jgi:hypothetical protein
MTSNILTSCFVLTAYGANFAPPLGISSASTHEALTNVSAYPTTPSTAKSVADRTGSTDRSVLPCPPRNYPQGYFTPHVRLATSPRPPPLFTDSIDVQRNPYLCTDHANPTPNICSAEAESVLVRNKLILYASHGTASSDMENFMKPLTPGQKRIQNNFPKNKCGYGPQLFYAMTRTCTMPTPAYHSHNPPPPPPPPPPPLSFCCELLYNITVLSISASLVASTACAFGFAKHFDKLTGLKIPCRELLLVFLALFPAPGAAATQGLADQSAIQVAVYINANASTTMVAVDNVTCWAQLVTACAAPSTNITLSPVFQMGAYTHEIDFRLVLYGCLN